GSFTGAVTDKVGLFEEASGGTLFLDEIGDLNLSLQAKLLRVLQDREIRPIGATKSKKIDVRLITATHKDLKQAVKKGEFREDLYYRLSVIPVGLPALRDRREDIPLLAHHFLKKYSALNGIEAEGFSSAAMAKLIRSPFPGNVRELENLIERAVVLSGGGELGVESVSFEVEEGGESVLADSANDWPTLHELEKRYIKAVLEKVSGKKEKAAEILGINRRTLYRKELEYNQESM
ncbi:MAG: sigma 54-interacting transcriptional regulator, partial [Pseudomonadota bacterium]